MEYVKTILFGLFDITIKHILSVILALFMMILGIFIFKASYNLVHSGCFLGQCLGAKANSQKYKDRYQVFMDH